MTGTANQIEWAEQIRPLVIAEFDRVASAFRTAADKQAEPDRTDTRAVIAILEEKRVEVMAKIRQVTSSRTGGNSRIRCGR